MPGLTSLVAHPLREALNDEVHSRPSADATAPLMVTQIAVITGETGAETERALLRELAAELGSSVPERFGNHLTVTLGPVHLVWERHTEFSTYAFSRSCAETSAGGTDLEAPFAETPLSEVPASWRAKLPGEVLVGINLLVVPGSVTDIEPKLGRVFGPNKVIGARTSGGMAAAWTDFRLHGDGLSRILVANEGLRPGRLGRLIQRLLDVETYRMMALLSFPMARDITPEIGDLEAQLSSVASETARIRGLADEQKLLGRLTALAARTEALVARTDYRFAAARAYHQLVERRIGELDEGKLEGMQQIGTFMNRRLGPAMRTCEAVERRLEALSERIARASGLLNTRVEVALQEQNQRLLTSMERRTRLQVRLQETVEGLSAVAISYYVIGLLAYVLKALEKAGQPVNPTIATGVLAPLVLAAAYLAVRQIRRRVVGSRGADI